MRELTVQETSDVNGGAGPLILLAAVAVVATGAFAVGVYNGYQSTREDSDSGSSGGGDNCGTGG